MDAIFRRMGYRQEPIPVGRLLQRDKRSDLNPDIFVPHPIAFDGVGPSQTSLNICEAAAALGRRIRIYGTRRRREPPEHCDLVTPLGNIGARLPYRRIAGALEAAIDRRIRAEIPAGATVYAWPALSAETAQLLKQRGCFIALEMINIPTLAEKTLIEAEMAREGFTYPHYVTDEKIANQQAFFELADVIFACNDNVVRLLVEGGIRRDRIVRTQYAASTKVPHASYEAERPVFIYVGRVNLEKGVHHLLRAWKEADVAGELHLYGKLDPLFGARYGDLLAHPTVRLMGFSKDMDRVYSSADGFLFMSLSEGGPLVTIEAASYGLPMLVSPMGGGFVTEKPGTAITTDPHDTAATARAIRELAGSAALRRQYGEAAYARALEFTWERAARERLAAIAAFQGRSERDCG